MLIFHYFSLQSSQQLLFLKTLGLRPPLPALPVARDLFLGLWIPDLFMQRVKECENGKGFWMILVTGGG